jgi:hypothetical protein
VTRGTERDVPDEVRRRLTLERRRRTIEYGYRVCGLWRGDDLAGAPRVCVMPHGHQTSPHRDADGEDFEPDPLRWLG